MLKGKWDKHGTQFVAQIRVGGAGADHVGKPAQLRAKDRSWTLVWLTRLIKDYGSGDVAIFEISRTMPEDGKPADGLPVDEHGRRL